MKKIAFAAVLGLSAIVMLAGFGGHHGHGPFGEDPAKLHRFIDFRINSALDDIKATDDQRKQVNAIKDDLFAEGIKLHQGQKAAKAELVAQWEAASPDAAKVHSVVDERIDALRAFTHKAADAAIRVHNLLSPEQRAELRSEMPGHE